MESPHHLLELDDLTAPVSRQRVTPLWGEVADGVVAPVVAQPELVQSGGVDEGVHRHQLDGGDAQRPEVLDGSRVGEPGVGAAELAGHPGMTHRESLDVSFVDDGVCPGDPRGRGPPPVEAVVDHDGERDVSCGIELAPDVIGHPPVPLVAEDLGAPPHRAGQSPGVGVDQQLVGVEPPTGRRLVGTVDPVSVEGSEADTGEVAVPGEIGPVDELVDGPGASVRVDQHQLHPLGVGAEEGEVGAVAVPVGAEREVLARPRVARDRGRSRCRPLIGDGRRRGLPTTR